MNRRSLLRTNRTTFEEGASTHTRYLSGTRASEYEMPRQNSAYYAESYYAEPYHESQILCAQIRGTLVDRIRVSTVEILYTKQVGKKSKKTFCRSTHCIQGSRPRLQRPFVTYSAAPTKRRPRAQTGTSSSSTARSEFCSPSPSLSPCCT